MKGPILLAGAGDASSNRRPRAILSDDSEFTYRGARSKPITVAVSAIVIIESVAVHFAVAVRHSGAAFLLTLTSLA
jgi:hypothetical protein